MSSRFMAQVTIANENTYLGMFKTRAEAAAVEDSFRDRMANPPAFPEVRCQGYDRTTTGVLMHVEACPRLLRAGNPRQVSHGLSSPCAERYMALNRARYCENCGERLRLDMFVGRAMYLRSKYCSQACWVAKNRTSRVIKDSEGTWIVLFDGRRSRISPEDAVFAAAYQWHVSSSTGYLATGRFAGKGKAYHRAILGPIAKGMHTDHINRDKLDNRRENLQVVPAAVNGRNHGMHKHNTSGINGVSWQPCWDLLHGKPRQRWRDGRGRWRVHIVKNDKQLFVGYFLDLEEAKAARIAAETKHWGSTREELSQRTSRRPASGVESSTETEVARTLPLDGPRVARGGWEGDPCGVGPTDPTPGACGGADKRARVTFRTAEGGAA